MNRAQNVCLDFQVKFETGSQKLGHQAKSKENLVNTLEVTFLKQSSWILPKMFFFFRWFLSQVWIWVMWGQKLGHQAKSKENLVNIPEVIFFK